MENSPETCGSVEIGNHLNAAEDFPRIRPRLGARSQSHRRIPNRGGSYHSLREHRHQSHSSVGIGNPCICRGTTAHRNSLRFQNRIESYSQVDTKCRTGVTNQNQLKFLNLGNYQNQLRTSVKSFRPRLHQHSHHHHLRALKASFNRLSQNQSQITYI